VKRRWQAALGIALSVAGLWWALHGVPWADLGQRLRGANPWLVLLCSIVATSIFPVRAIRWGVILDPVAPGLPFGPRWRAVAIGMMANNLLPARLGELARAYALTRERPDVRFTSSLASLVVDRLFDAAAVLLMMAAAMLDPHFLGVADFAGVSARSAATLAIALPAIGFAVIIAVAARPQVAISLFRRVARRVAPGIEARGTALLKGFEEGLRVVRSPRRFLLVLFWALVMWLLNALAFWIGFRALHINASLAAALFVQGVIVAFVSMPSTPGFAGVFEIGARVGLAAFAIPATAAAAWAITFHVVSYIPITVLGLWYLSRAGLTYRDFQQVAAHRNDEVAS
jgi:uncharacterized protein (TIRG00374 family)